ncbi:MAG: cell division protein FtsA [Candidatus Paceibacterota bacterium]
MIRNISIGIDVGSAKTKVIVGEFIKGEKYPRVIGFGESESNGIRHGYVTNFIDGTNSVKNAVMMAEKNSGIKIKRAFVSVSGTTLRSEISSGSAIISKANSEVTNLDIKKALEDCENNLNLNNKKIIHTFPISFKLDGKDILGRIEGMCGNKLEIRSVFITYSSQHLEDLLSIIADAGVETIDIIAAPIAGSHIVLSEKQKIVGCALVNIGAETVSLSIFENNMLVSLRTFSIGSSNITNDIALGLKIPLEDAENMKLGNLSDNYPKKKLDEIVDARLSDIFESIENHLKKIKRNELLPAGIVFTGGGANVGRLEELSKSFLKLPSKIGSTEIFSNIKTKLRDPSYFVALGLITHSRDNNKYTEGSFANMFKDIKNSLKSMAKQLMP